MKQKYRLLYQILPILQSIRNKDYEAENMNYLYLWLVISFSYTLFLWKLTMPKANESSVNIGRFTVPLLFLLALVLRVILAGSFIGFSADVGCFSSWADRMVEIGPSGFYSADYFSDYPPLYLYILFLIGLLKKAFSIASYSPVHLVLLKLPAILSDLAIGYMIYRICNKLVGLRSSLLLTCIYLFQPVTILNSSLWGQIDSFFTLFLIAICIFLERQQLLPSMLLFALGLLLKPQMLIFSPLLIVGFIQYVFRGGFSMRMLTKASAYALLSVILILLLASPFGMENVISQYADTVSSYPYASVNAYNFWAGMGLNWYPQTTYFMGLEAKTWGFLAIVLAAGLSILLGLRLGNLHQKYAVMGAFLITTVFTYSVRMHERYLYMAFPLLLLAFAGFCSRQLCRLPNANRNQEMEQTQILTITLRIVFPIMYSLMVCLHFYNCGYVLFYYDPQKYKADAPELILSGIGMVLCSLLLYYALIRLQTKKEFDVAFQASSIQEKIEPLKIKKEKLRISRADLLFLLGITLLYSIFAFHDLGSMDAPQTCFSMTKNQIITLQFSEDHKAASFYYFTAPEHDRNLLIHYGQADTEEMHAMSAKLGNVFTWKEIGLPEACERLSLTANSNKTNILELVFLDADGNVTTPKNAQEYSELFDEQDAFPDRISFRNSMYFDEIYHARTAYEYIHGLRSYENTHPPLGKILISFGILLFGMNPFGWRIAGTIFGILMLPVLYLFAKRMTGETSCAALTCFIFAFDFMHFTQTRIATIDVFIVFFIICMYYFLFYFFTLDYGATKLKHFYLPLGLCGISMGLGVASKWTGVYAGIGMGILFFGYLYIMYRKQKKLQKSAKLVSDKDFDFKTKTSKLIAFCLLFFVLVPAVIYLFSYLPFRDGSDHSWIKQALDNQKTMYDYHSNLVATHYFASPFYEWPFIIKPIWYYSGILSDTLREGISSFGNPLVWWAGIPALLYMLYLTFRKKDGRACFLVISYLAQYLPWFFVERLTFIYHYFPSVIFLVLMIGYGFRNLKEALPKKGYYAVLICYALLVFGLFLLFYPVLAGQPITFDFARKYLKWFKTWILVSG